MAEIVRYVNTASAGGDGTTNNESGGTAAYASMSAAEAGENGALSGDWLHIYYDTGSGTAADTTGHTWNGFTFGSAADYVLNEANTGQGAKLDGQDLNLYRLAVSGATAITLRDDNIRFKGIQFISDGNYIFDIWGIGASSDLRYSECRFTGAATSIALTTGDGDVNMIVENCIFDDWSQGLYMSAGEFKINNNIFYDNGTGIYLGASVGTTTIKNNALFNNTDDINDSSSATIDYNASVDNDGTNNVAESSSDTHWTDDFEDAANGDFRVKSTSNLVGAGVGPGTDSDIPTIDMGGDTRSGATCDVGADEYVAAGGGSIVVLRRRRAA